MHHALTWIECQMALRPASELSDGTLRQSRLQCKVGLPLGRYVAACDYCSLLQPRSKSLLPALGTTCISSSLCIITTRSSLSATALPIRWGNAKWKASTPGFRKKASSAEGWMAQILSD